VKKMLRTKPMNSGPKMFHARELEAGGSGAVSVVSAMLIFGLEIASARAVKALRTK
jgi:hypothetical protein